MLIKQCIGQTLQCIHDNMHIKTLDGYDLIWKPTGSNKKVSSLQERAIEVIATTIPGILMLHEVSVPVEGNKTLWFDIFLIKQKIMVEVQGRQHGSTRIPFFFQSKKKHMEQQRNDQLKRDWCTLNNIPLVELCHSETVAEWETKIKQAIYQKS